MNFRIRDYIVSPAAIFRHHRFLQESQYWSSQKRRSYIQEKLDKILTHAVKKIPYYKQTLSPYQSQFNEMIDKLDLSLLPILTKDHIRQNYQALIAENSEQLGARSDRTSGSTGSAMKFLLDRQSHVNNFAAIWRMLNWTGYQFGNRYVSIIPNMEKKTHREIIYDIRQNCLQFPFVNLRKEKIRKYVKFLKFFNPVIIKSYASSLALFAQWIQEAGILNSYRPVAVLSCAETLLDHQKKIMNEVFQCPIFDFYGQNERACLISTCEKGKYHIHEEYSFVEFKHDHQASMQSQPAHIISTTFDNFAMPLIRYQTNDMAVMNLETSPCACGRTYQMIEKIIGRVDDVIFTPQGLQVARLDNAFKESPGITEAQIVQKNMDKIQINIVRSNSFVQNDIDNLLRRLNYRLGLDMQIEFNFVDSILAGKNGKKKFIVSEMKNIHDTSSRETILC